MGSRVRHSRVEVHVRCVEGAMYGSWWSRCHWCRASCRSVSPRRRNTKCRVLSFWILQSNCALVVRLYSVIVNFICNQIVAYFCIAKACHLRCCLYKVMPSAVHSTILPSSRMFYTQSWYPGGPRIPRFVTTRNSRSFTKNHLTLTV